MDPALQQSLELLDNAAAVIQELMAQLQAKSQQSNMTKKAEELAIKSGVSFDEASDIIKTASDHGTDADTLIKAAGFMNRNASFGRVASEEQSSITKTGSVATDKYLEKEAALMDELGY
jgi:hypothetical protein